MSEAGSEVDQSDFSFIHDMEDALTFRGPITDFEWDLRNKQWDEHRQKIIGDMLDSSVWRMAQKHKETEESTSEKASVSVQITERTSIALKRVPEEQTLKDDSILPTTPPSTSTIGTKFTAKTIPPTGMSNVSRIVWKVPRMSRLELLKYLNDWDKASFGNRDKIILDFIRTYETMDHVYDTDQAFYNGGSLIFSRFAVGLIICFLKHRKIWHYYDALGIFVKSLQGDRYAEEFCRLGGMNYIIQVIRVVETSELDKLRALYLLLSLMKSRGGHSVKLFICDTPNMLESLVDSLTMCKSRPIIASVGQIMEQLCIEIPPEKIPVVCGYIMHALPCDFNPMLQSMAFRVLQGFVRLKPSLAPKCIKPILDNLKTTDSELLAAMSNLSLVILQTKHSGELITSLMEAGEGLHLREVFKSVIRSQFQSRGLTAAEVSREVKKLREKRDKLRTKQLKFDQYMHQAGALFILNHMMTNKIESVDDFVEKGIVGLSLKALGTCPHWEVQGQGVTMIKFLASVSLECALSYYMMLPLKMMELIIMKPQECLRYFTAPICVHLRKLGRFALRMWPHWVQKAVVVAKLYAKGNRIPEEVFQLSQMARKVQEMNLAMARLLESPAMEAPSRPPSHAASLHEVETSEDEEEFYDFWDTSEEEVLEKMAKVKEPTELITTNEEFEPFTNFLETDLSCSLSSDEQTSKMLVADSTKQMMKELDDKELDEYQAAMLKEIGSMINSKASEDPDEDKSEEEMERDHDKSSSINITESVLTVKEQLKKVQIQ